MVTPPEVEARQGAIDDFHVALDVFEGPFDLLLQLITRKRLDITEVALAEVTDEFIAHMRMFPDLSKTTEFLVVAATLLDLKAQSLLPSTQIDRELAVEDLEARDLLFTRLLQYRAFKGASAQIAASLEENAGFIPRAVPLEPHFAALLPELVWTASPLDLVRAAAAAFSSTEPHVVTAHLHDPVVPVREQARIVVERLARLGKMTFRELIEDAATTPVVVSRFLAVLELYRRRALDVAQDEPLGELVLVWTGGDAQDVDFSDIDATEEPGQQGSADG